MLGLVRYVLGPQARILRVAPHALPQDTLARISRVNNVVHLYVKDRLSPEAERFGLAHELGHHVLGHAREARTRELELEADYFAACLVLPRTALRSARSILGDDLAGLAEVFCTTQTAVALRLGEAGSLPAVIVVAPAIVRVRSLTAFVVPPEDALRKLATARTLHPGLRRTKLTDATRRVALLVDEEQVA